MKYKCCLKHWQDVSVKVTPLCKELRHGRLHSAYVDASAAIVSRLLGLHLPVLDLAFLVRLPCRNSGGFDLLLHAAYGQPLTGIAMRR